jgi:hypothetical protein
MNDIIIKPEEFGLEANEAKQVQAVFVPMLEAITQLENEYNQIITLPISEETTKKAKELRLKFVKIRTKTAEIHKKAKAYYLAGGRFVDAFKNAQLQASGEKETTLKEIEDYYVNLEKERLQQLQALRIEEISAYVDDVTAFDLSSMADDVYLAYFNSKKKDYEDKIKAEQEAEKARLKAEEEEKARIEAQKIENEKLKAEAEAREKLLQKEREEARKKQDELEAKAKAEAEAREKLEAEKAQKEAEIKAQYEAKQVQEKQEKYQLWLKDNKYNEDTDIIINNILYRKISQYILDN